MKALGEWEATNEKIIGILKKNGRMPFSRLANEVGLSVNAVTNRIEKLIKNKVIRRFTVDVGTSHFILLKIKARDDEGSQTAIENAVRAFAENEGCIEAFYAVSGEYDYLVTFVSRREADLFEFFRWISKTGVVDAHVQAGVMTEIDLTGP
jgi:Lrp/AsnC family leucine-responsive transcriptional regulator